MIRIHLRAQDPAHKTPSLDEVIQVLADEPTRRKILDEMTERQISEAYARGEEVRQGKKPLCVHVGIAGT